MPRATFQVTVSVTVDYPDAALHEGIARGIVEDAMLDHDLMIRHVPRYNRTLRRWRVLRAVSVTPRTLVKELSA